MAIWKPEPVHVDVSAAAMEEADALIRSLTVALFESCAVIHLLSERRKPERACDLPAERKALGWALTGRASASDFDDLDLLDFAEPLHRMMYAVVGEIKASGFFSSQSLRSRAFACTELTWPERAQDARELRLRMPAPAVVPQREIDLVCSLGRAWSGVEERFEMDVCRVEA